MKAENKNVLELAKSNLSRDEIFECFESAFSKLDDDDKKVIDGLLGTAKKKIKNVGAKSALELIGKIAVGEVLL